MSVLRIEILRPRHLSRSDFIIKGKRILTLPPHAINQPSSSIRVSSKGHTLPMVKEIGLENIHSISLDNDFCFFIYSTRAASTSGFRTP